MLHCDYCISLTLDLHVLCVTSQMKYATEKHTNWKCKRF